jgi:hypothetical protein
VLGAYFDADFDWSGAWGLLFGGWWRDLGDPELPGGPEIKSMRGPGGDGGGLEAAGGRTIGGGNGILGPYISQPGRPPLGGAGGYTNRPIYAMMSVR